MLNPIDLAREWERRSHVLTQALSDKVEDIIELESENGELKNTIDNLNDINRSIHRKYKMKIKKLKATRVTPSTIFPDKTQLVRLKQIDKSYQASVDQYELEISKMMSDHAKNINIEIKSRDKYAKENCELFTQIKMLKERVKELEFTINNAKSEAEVSDWSDS